MEATYFYVLQVDVKCSLLHLRKGVNYTSVTWQFVTRNNEITKYVVCIVMKASL